MDVPADPENMTFLPSGERTVSLDHRRQDAPKGSGFWPTVELGLELDAGEGEDDLSHLDPANYMDVGVWGDSDDDFEGWQIMDEQSPGVIQAMQRSLAGEQMEVIWVVCIVQLTYAPYPQAWPVRIAPYRRI